MYLQYRIVECVKTAQPPAAPPANNKFINLAKIANRINNIIIKSQRQTNDWYKLQVDAQCCYDTGTLI